MTRLLIVGCGRIATAAHLPALAAMQAEGLVEVVACDVDATRAQAAATRFGMTAGTDWRAAAAGVDAVAVCLPPGPNAEVAAEAAAMGLHVLCEKPPGRTRAQARRMAEAAEAHPERVTMVAFNRRYNSIYRQAVERSLALGPPTSYYGRVSLPHLGIEPSDSVDDWITSDSSHAVDLAVATMGFPHALSVDHRGIGPGPDNSWTIHLHCASGSAVLLLHYAAGRRVERVEWAGPGYDVHLDLPKSGEWAQATTVTPWAGSGAFHDLNGFTDQYRAFLGAIAGSAARPVHDFAYGADFLALLDLIRTASPITTNPVVCDVPAHSAAGAVTPVAQSALSPAPASASDARPGRRVVVLHQPAPVLTRFFTEPTLAALRDRCDLRLRDGVDGLGGLDEADVIVTGRGTKAPPAAALGSDRLRLLVVIGASVRGVGVEALLDRGVTVCNTADAVAQSVAEHCLMVSLAGLRRLTAADRGMHARSWREPEGAPGWHLPDVRALIRRIPLPSALRTPLGQLERRLAGGPPAGAGVDGAGPGGGAPEIGADLRGQVVGLIGWGHTARHFAALLVPFGCTVLVASDAAEPADLQRAGARPATIGEILGSARVVSLHKGLTDRTRGLLGDDRLTALRPGTVLVNAARAELIDEGALLRRLAQRDIVVALDVFAEEPLPVRHPLRSHANVILTPHQASTTEQEERRMGAQAAAIVIDWLDGRKVDAITAHRLSRMT